MRRTLVGLISVSALFFVVVGALHAPPLRALLRSGPSCPVGGDVNATPHQREANRRFALAPRMGTQPAPVHEAFGFTLGLSNVEAVAAWKQEAKATCRTERAGLVEECDVASLSRFGSALPGTVFFRSDDAGRLVAVLVTARVTDAEASGVQSNWSATLESRLGQPHLAQGELSTALLSQQRREHRFSDLLASVSATQMGDAVRVNLELQSLTARD